MEAKLWEYEEREMVEALERVRTDALRGNENPIWIANYLLSGA